MKSYLQSFRKSARRRQDVPPPPDPMAEAAAAFLEGSEFAARWRADAQAPSASPTGSESNPLWQHFANYSEGPGLWKWTHYFDIYHRHFQGFVGKPVNVLEIGIFSGGSLPMWLRYFGDQCRVFGVDIEEACRAYESDRVRVFVGDQEDRAFWRQFRNEAPEIDVLIDDGGHTPEQQRVTLEEMLPHLRPGGVYLCEDVHGVDNRFAAYAAGLANQLNGQTDIPGEALKSEVSAFQRSIYSIHFYPYLVVIEKNIVGPTELLAPRHGAQWQPFL